MFESRSKALFVSAILGILYAGYVISYFLGVNANSVGVEEQIGGVITTALVFPHIVLITLAAIFNVLAFYMNSRGFAITCSVLYAVGGAAFIVYIVFVLPMIILSFIGITKVVEINQNLPSSGLMC